jgi:hypothetical protein
MDNLLKQKDEIRDSFNKIATVLFTHLANKYPETEFGTYRITIHKYITELPYEPVAQFIKHVYSNDNFREKIIAGDETFFLTQTYDDHSSEQNQIFMMKDIWTKMDQHNKQFVKNAFKSLVDRCKLYIDVLCDINKIKNTKH